MIAKSRLLARLGQVEKALIGIRSNNILHSSNPDDQLNIALVFLRCGEVTEVKNALERAVQQGYPLTLVLAEAEFTPVRDEDWFKSLLALN